MNKRSGGIVQEMSANGSSNSLVSEHNIQPCKHSEWSIFPLQYAKRIERDSRKNRNAEHLDGITADTLHLLARICSIYSTLRIVNIHK